MCSQKQPVKSAGSGYLTCTAPMSSEKCGIKEILSASFSVNSQFHPFVSFFFFFLPVPFSYSLNLSSVNRNITLN